MERLTAELGASRQEKGRLMKQISELQGKIDTLSSQIQSQQDEHKRDSSVRAKLQDELDELRALLATKVTEETRRSEAEKSKEEEITLLRSQATKLSQDLSDVRKSTLESQSKLKVELDTLVREHNSLQSSHKSLSDREQVAQSQLKKVEATLADLEKNKRATDSDLQSLRSRQIDIDGQLAEAVKEKEVMSLGIFLQLFTHSCHRHWNVSLTLRKRNTRTSRMSSYNSSETRPPMIVSWRRLGNSWKVK